jgi:hypothetical protein
MAGFEEQTQLMKIHQFSVVTVVTVVTCRQIQVDFWPKDLFVSTPPQYFHTKLFFNKFFFKLIFFTFRQKKGFLVSPFFVSSQFRLRRNRV